MAHAVLPPSHQPPVLLTGGAGRGATQWENPSVSPRGASGLAARAVLFRGLLPELDALPSLIGLGLPQAI